MLHRDLTRAQERELRRFSRQAVGRVALRAHSPALRARLPGAPDRAHHGCGEDVVRTWLHRYQRRGVAGLHDRPKSGRPPMDRLAGAILDAQASQSPRCAAAHPRAPLLWLPTYAAHGANPVERIWGLLKGEVAADRLEGDLATLVAHARRSCADLPPHPASTWRPHYSRAVLLHTCLCASFRK